MAVMYKTFPLKDLQEYQFCTDRDMRSRATADYVDEEIENRRKEGWHLRGSPWVQYGSIFLTMWRED